MRWLCSSRMTLAFRQHHLVGELQAGHAVGLEFHHGFKLLARHALIKTGVVAGGEGIFLAAVAGDDLRERADRMFRRALEHQVFEEMRQPRFARRLVGGADFVPDHMGDHRRAVIGDDDQFEAIGQPVIGDRRPRRLRGGRGRDGASRHEAGKRRRITVKFKRHSMFDRHGVACS